MQTNKEYWLSGGIYGVLIYIILAIISAIITPAQAWFSWFTIVTFFANVPFFLVARFIFGNDVNYPNGSISMIFIASVLFFVVFSIFGWIYGKIKSRKQ